MKETLLEEETRLRKAWKKWNNTPGRHPEDMIGWFDFYHEHKRELSLTS